jgi:hypothetical protein
MQGDLRLVQHASIIHPIPHQPTIYLAVVNTHKITMSAKVAMAFVGPNISEASEVATRILRPLMFN